MLDLIVVWARIPRWWPRANRVCGGRIRCGDRGVGFPRSWLSTNRGWIWGGRV